MWQTTVDHPEYEITQGFISFSLAKQLSRAEQCRRISDDLTQINHACCKGLPGSGQALPRVWVMPTYYFDRLETQYSLSRSMANATEVADRCGRLFESF